ncbi:hypothetical protein OTU49_010158, partial [Cherax quadricarinatus]
HNSRLSSSLSSSESTFTHFITLIVTGATDGIGKAYAIELAKKGMNIVLISRTQEKLEKVAQEIRGQYEVETDIVRADFTDGRPIYDNIRKHLEGKEVGILVNNVGVVGSIPCLFKDAPEDDIWALLNVNSAAVPAMIKLVLPGMMARRKGAIVNISSMAGSFPLPLLQIYCGTKVNNYSRTCDIPVITFSDFLLFFNYFSLRLQEDSAYMVGT